MERVSTKAQALRRGRHPSTHSVEQAGAIEKSQRLVLATVVAAEVEFGLRELDPSHGRVVGLGYWHASRLLPAELLKMLPAPPVGVAG